MVPRPALFRSWPWTSAGSPEPFVTIADSSEPHQSVAIGFKHCSNRFESLQTISNHFEPLQISLKSFRMHQIQSTSKHREPLRPTSSHFNFHPFRTASNHFETPETASNLKPLPISSNLKPLQTISKPLVTMRTRWNPINPLQ